MHDWLAADAAPDAVLVTVAAVEGSGPREPGAKMLVDGARAFGTIGGGHLEHEAIALARAMLADGRARLLQRYALGPTLGQCCGGVVHLAFERHAGAHADAVRARAAATLWRLVALDGAPESCAVGAGDAAPFPFDRAQATHVHVEADGRRWLVDRVDPPQAQLLLFGAGHVGTALVRALAGLPCRVTWVDERADLFPATVPAHVTIEATDTPEAVVAQAPPGAAYLVMTHSHALDERLAAAILARPQVLWFGLIGSATKRARFERRLRAQGVEEARIAAMACPIGLPGIRSKLPAVIAASVAAQLLTVWEAQAACACAPPIRLVAARRS